MSGNENYTINVRTFGGFSIRYKGEELSFGNQSESQMVQLLQLLLHYRKQGLSRDLAKAALFGDRDVDDVSHSIRNIIYNLRKKLRGISSENSGENISFTILSFILGLNCIGGNKLTSKPS